MPSPVRRLTLLLATATLLVPGLGCQDFSSFWFPRRLAGDVRAMEDPDFADERRSGIAGIQRRPEVREDPYMTRFRQIAVTDSSPEVRAQAVRALNQARDPAAGPAFLDALAYIGPDPRDPRAKNNDRVRLEAAKALRNMPDERAIPRLTQLALDEDENRDVRMWSANALGRYNRLDVARTLVRLLGTNDFGVAYEARGSLRRLTGKDFYYDEGLWLNFLAGNPNPFARSQIKAPTTAPSRPVR